MIKKFQYSLESIFTRKSELIVQRRPEEDFCYVLTVRVNMESLLTFCIFGILSSSFYYIHNVSVDTSFGLLQAFHIKLGSLNGTSKRTFYLIHTLLPRKSPEVICNNSRIIIILNKPLIFSHQHVHVIRNVLIYEVWLKDSKAEKIILLYITAIISITIVKQYIYKYKCRRI